MTGDSTSVSNMRTVFLHVSMLAVLAHTVNAYGEDSDCDPAILVFNNTRAATVGEYVEISCTVVTCNDSPSTEPSWYRLQPNPVIVNISGQSHITTEKKNFSSTSWTLHLVFHGIRLTDAGQYLCRNKASSGHKINVSVHGSVDVTTVTWKNNRSKEDRTSLAVEKWMYLYSAAGIVAFVIIVIIASVIAMQGCGGKTSKQEGENQYVIIPIPMAESFDSHPEPGARPLVSTPQRQNDSIYANPKTKRGIKRTAADAEENSVLYASLNHQPLVVSAPRPRMRQEEETEYAAICVS
ncbi:B- and T-lymphocyte attenuator isoform X2 [Cynoglossus semilaevis]|uniref:B- and T-lymphocyte attenuator isoform X2 n=1 Tax=Cynoglossus semilaevis TaxID=244447 RepID=UPI0007DCA02F|nr:B- and T-lymphocyte attenuator-like isoform X2 [Cynoglossus semilaevis]